MKQICVNTVREVEQKETYREEYIPVLKRSIFNSLQIIQLEVKFCSRHIKKYLNAAKKVLRKEHEKSLAPKGGDI